MKEFKIKKFDSNQRVDKYVKKLLPNASLSLIYKTFRKKDIKVNGKWVKQDYILKENDELKIFLSDEVFESSKEEKSIYDLPSNLDIIYEDENILVVNKEKGLLIHGDKNENVYTLSNKVISYLYKKEEYNPRIDTFIPSPVHRLDRNTSGVCVFAKNMLTSQLLMDEFKDKKNLEKHYLALVFGNSPKNGEINAPLKKDSNNNLVKVDFNSKDAKDALTLYSKIDGNDEYSLLDVNLITGRTHQIRVHLSYKNLPIVGDEKYGDFNKNKIFESKYKYKKQFLHAYSLEFKEMKGHLKYLSNKKFIGKLNEEESKILEKLGLKY